MRSILSAKFNALFTDGVIREMNRYFSESEIRLYKAMEATFYISLASIIRQVANGEAYQFYALAEAHTESYMLNHEGTSLEISIESFFIKPTTSFDKVFPKNEMSAIRTISKYANVKRTTALNILSYGLPILLSLIGKQIRDDRCDKNEFKEMIMGIAIFDGDMLPEELNRVAVNMRYGSLRHDLLQLGKIQKRRYAIIPFWKSSYDKWMGLWVCVLVILIAYILTKIFHISYDDIGKKSWGKLFKNAEAKNVVLDSVAGEPLVDTIKNTVVTKETEKTNRDLRGEFVTVRLPDGNYVETCDTCICKRIIDYLALDEQPPAMRIFLDSLTFAPGQWKIPATGINQLNSIAVVIKAFPTSTLIIGGHTDASGSSKYNMELSKDRAREVYNYFLDKDVPKSQLLGFNGYGAEFAGENNNGRSSGNLEKERTISLEIHKAP